MSAVVATSTTLDEHQIKPETITPKVDTTEWPLLLKDYDKRELLGSADKTHEMHARAQFLLHELFASIVF